MRRQTVASIALALLALLFGWRTREALNATPGGTGDAGPAAAAAWRPGEPAPDPQPPPDPSPAAAAVAARPLFRPDRQPFREATAGAAGRNYEAEMSRFQLVGVFGFGNAPVGVVVGKTGTKGERWEVKRGDALPGFKVKEVGMDGLRLLADGKEFLLPLYAGAPPAAGSNRTEAGRRDAAQAAPGAPVAAAPARGNVLPTRAAPFVSPLLNRLRRVPPAQAAPGTPQAPGPPASAPESIPGR